MSDTKIQKAIFDLIAHKKEISWEQVRVAVQQTVTIPTNGWLRVRANLRAFETAGLIKRTADVNVEVFTVTDKAS